MCFILQCLCYSAPGQWWFWCKTDPTCLAGIFLDMNSDIWKENPVNESWRKAFWPGRGSHQMARRCHGEAGASKGAGGAGHWSGTGAACWVFYKQQEIFVGLFYVAKENRKVGRLDWEGITGFLLILISGQNLGSSSRVWRAGKIRWLGKRWSFGGFCFWVFFNWIDFLNLLTHHSEWVMYSKSDIPPLFMGIRRLQMLPCCKVLSLCSLPASTEPDIWK